jgi:hypothetical protein
MDATNSPGALEASECFPLPSCSGMEANEPEGSPPETNGFTCGSTRAIFKPLLSIVTIDPGLPPSASVIHRRSPGSLAAGRHSQDGLLRYRPFPTPQSGRSLL